MNKKPESSDSWVFRLYCEAGLRDCTAETRRTRSKEFLIKKFSELCTAIVEIVRKLR